MGEITISKHRKNGKHVGWKKYVLGRNFHLASGTDYTNQQKAKAIARALVARAELLKLEGKGWTDEVVEECFRIAEGTNPPPAVNQPTPAAPPVTSMPPAAVSVLSAVPTLCSLLLYDIIEKYKQNELGREKAGEISHRHRTSTWDRIERSKDGIANIPISSVLREPLDRWVRHWRARPISKGKSGKPVSPEWVVGVTGAMRHFLKWAKSHGYWQGVEDWESVFKGVTIKKLRTPAERKQKSKQPLNFSVEELQLLWHFATPDAKAIITLATWAGHTQTEMATVMFDEFEEEDAGLLLDRYRNKTGVHGRWWLPPEGAGFVRHWLNRTPKDQINNPNRLAFLTSKGLPLVHASAKNDRYTCDTPGLLWNRLLRTAKPYGVRPISLKYARKTFSQLVRNELGEEFSKLFCAHQHDGVQDTAYTRACMAKLEACIRERIYPVWKQMFEKPDLRAILERVRVERDMAASARAEPSSQQDAA